MRVVFENKNTEIEELKVRFYPKYQCPLNILPTVVDGVDYGKPCRSDCMWQGSRGFEEQPICKCLEYLMKIHLK